MTCPRLPPLLHGHTEGAGRQYGDTVEHSCNPGYRLAGAARQCALRDGEISGMENCGLCFLGLIVGLLGITFLVVLIWVRKKLNFQFYMKVFIASATHLVAGVSRDIQQLAKLDERRCT